MAVAGCIIRMRPCAGQDWGLGTRDFVVERRAVDGRHRVRHQDAALQRPPPRAQGYVPMA